MAESIKITVEQAASELLAHDQILIIAHASPDGDTLGGSFALWNALVSLGKQARVECSDPFPARFSYLYEGYQAEGFEERYVVAVDTAAVQLLGGRLSSYAPNINICIDHHPSNGLYAALTCLRPEAAAACEIMAELVHCLGAAVTERIADCLYTGIATDTGCFKFSNTTANTHRVAAELISRGADYQTINEYLFDTKSKSRITVEQQVLSRMEFFAGDQIAVTGITQEMIERSHADESELDGVSGIPRMIEGVKIGITLREKPDGSHKVSVRTNREADASKICAEFGGGGHARAAGCLLHADYETAKSRLVEASERFLAKSGGSL